jgi:hypothetical protein
MGRSTTAASVRKRAGDGKVTESRLSVLELEKELGNVVEACRQRGLDRTSFGEWKRRFQTHGLGARTAR